MYTTIHFRLILKYKTQIDRLKQCSYVVVILVIYTKYTLFYNSFIYSSLYIFSVVSVEVYILNSNTITVLIDL